MSDRNIDPERARKPAFDNDRGYSGQDYDIREERRLAAEMPAGSVNAKPSSASADPDTPPDAGRRASFDPVTGETRGSGTGAGGGNAGEDPDSDSAGGDGPVITGAQADKPAT
jgi:hypothetical protein